MESARLAVSKRIRAAGGLGQKVLFLLLGRQHHHHLPAFHLGELLNLTKWLQIQLQTLQHPHADLLVGHLATPEAQRDLGLVAFFQEFHQIAQLDAVVAVVRTRAKLDLLIVSGRF